MAEHRHDGRHSQHPRTRAAVHDMYRMLELPTLQNGMDYRLSTLRNTNINVRDNSTQFHIYELHYCTPGNCSPEVVLGPFSGGVRRAGEAVEDASHSPGVDPRLRWRQR